MNSMRAWLIRVAGIALLTAVALWFIFDVIGSANIGWLWPWRYHHARWPEDLAPFRVTQGSAPDGTNTQVFYTVPSRQLTPREAAELRGSIPSPAATPTPPPATSAGR